MCQLRVAIWDVGGLLVQRAEHIRKGRERLVDILRLLETVPFRSRARNALAPGQVAHAQAAHDLGAILAVHADNEECEHRVAARRVVVAVSGGHRPVLVREVENAMDVVTRGDGKPLRVGHDNLLLRVPNLEFLGRLGSLAGRDQEILDGLIVNLDIGRLQRVLPATGAQLHLVGHDLVDRPRDDAAVLLVRKIARHGEGFARAGLAIAEQAHVVPVQSALHKAAHLVEDLLLRGVRLEHSVKRKVVLLDLSALALLLLDFHCQGLAIHAAAHKVGKAQAHLLAVLIDCALRDAQHRANPRHYPHLALERLHFVVKLALGFVGLEELLFSLLELGAQLGQLLLEAVAVRHLPLEKLRLLRNLAQALEPSVAAHARICIGLFQRLNLALKIAVSLAERVYPLLQGRLLLGALGALDFVRATFLGQLNV
mmetsp:Transcript_2055/g.6361  ORF Transcript_2055/g.6361 Transcript_2055/m.6361 type:complete len:427 (+) Transcript_2055:264-1544(+)